MRKRVVVGSRRPVWITLGGALLFHILLLSLQTNHIGGPGLMRMWLLNLLTPAERIVDGGANGVWGIWSGYFALVGVRGENEKLRAENDQLRLQLDLQTEEVREAERLRTLLDLKASGVGKTVVARIIGRDTSIAHQTVTINKGLAHGVKPNSSVITAAGVVGRVIHVGHSSAIVQLVTDAQSAVGVMVRSTRVQAVFKGTGGPELELDYIDNDNEINPGDELITSGLDQIHPKGLLLGVVTSVGEPVGLFKAVKLRPAVALSRLEEVICVTEKATPPPEELEKPSATLPSE
jgi:rod shape-determining protein MreC